MTNVEKLVKELCDKIDSMQEIIDNRGKFIDFVGEHYPEIVQEYLKGGIEKTKCCGNCEYYYCSNDTKGKCKLLNSNVNKCGFNICAKWELAE